LAIPLSTNSATQVACSTTPLEGATTHLEEDLETVERGGAGTRDGARSSPGNQVPPPHPCLHLLFREVIRDDRVVTDVDNL